MNTMQILLQLQLYKLIRVYCQAPVEGGPAEPFPPGPWLKGAPSILLFNSEPCNKLARMWEFHLIELLTYYSWPSTDIRFYCLDNLTLENSLHCRPSFVLRFSRRLVRNKL
jgi:hypothetical protein